MLFNYDLERQEIRLIGSVKEIMNIGIVFLFLEIHTWEQVARTITSALLMVSHLTGLGSYRIANALFKKTKQILNP